MIRFLLVLSCCATCILSTSDNSTPKIIIVGAGPAGIAAASRLLDNGFTGTTILEAEDRIGGRVYSIKFGEYMVDLGGQWVHGEKNNVVYELVSPLGLVEKFDENYNFSIKYFGSSGTSLPFDVSTDLGLFSASLECDLNDEIDNLKTGTFGEYADAKLDEYYKNHPEISSDLHKPLRYMMNLTQMAADGANSWYDVSAKGIRAYEDCDDEKIINWKNRTYSTILDILMKKFPNPEEELPVMNNTRTNSKIIKIDYKENSGPIKVTTEDGKEYLADHVIFTPSLGVLKANYEQLFDPPLPENKVQAIKNIGFGHVAKIMLYYDNPWWDNTANLYNVKSIFWTEADRNEIENDPEKKWMLGISSLISIEHKPKLLCIWMSSDHSAEMETIPDELFRNQTLAFIRQFFGNEYNLTDPTEIKRTLWNTNENFRGTYSYRGVEADVANVSHVDFAEPIIRNDKPILLFAGEATSERYGTVNGAIESGWREANRLIRYLTRNTFIEN